MQLFFQRRWQQSKDLGAWLIRCWPVVVAICGLYVAGLYWLGINLTSSLPYRVVWIEHGRQPVRGDLMVYAFYGQPLPTYGYIHGARFFKRVAGMPGDVVRVDGREVYVGDRYIGTAKPWARSGTRLTPIAQGPIPEGHYFAQSDSVDSFDSRYAQSGLVKAERVIGVARVLF